ncbi:hypothetical protein [Alteromonas halophila]|uniref:Uncharacterized protein n=1 Tax=Alteromonas halophila TaxID=516698 RepID=A0A918JJN8_9ALTE|nr:hypothetical protein [Alteromonas halophila]GGW80685.1 hypothetical protein GCM10007391_12040 [Alteromonas halophila]
MTSTFAFFKRFIPCWVVTYCLASILHTQMVLTGLVQVDVAIPVADWVSMTAYDLWGLLPAYGSATLGAMLIAMLIVSWLVQHQSRMLTLVLCMCAGALAMLVMLLAMQPIMQVTLIAGARSSVGMALQCLAGLLGGLVYAMLWHHQRHE